MTTENQTQRSRRKKIIKEVVIPEKYSRQAKCVPPAVFEKRVLVVGCGAVGRNIVLQLTQIGIPYIKVYDFDTVEEHNISSQGFLVSDIGKPKVDCIKEYCRNINPDVEIQAVNDVWRPDFEFYDYIFLCPDCMTVRTNISRYYHNRKQKTVLIDTRMRGEEMRVLMTWNQKTRAHYNKQLFSNEEAADGSCTSSTTTYCAMATASMAIQNMVNHMKKGYLRRDIVVNLSNGIMAEL